MNAKLKVVMRKAEGALLRLLGQVGRRGYDILRVNADLTPDRKAWHVIVEFESIMPAPPGVQQQRPPEVLPALVAKLVDVVSVELVLPGGVKPAAESPKAPAPAKKGDISEWTE